ncbi:MAG: hypothetical protein J5I81_09400 [Nitrococcus mobilis]|nr:hypothetical protein [Nitrococcus mobilis]
MSASPCLLVLLGLGAAVLTGCGNPLMVKPGEHDEIGNAYRVDPQIEWSRQQDRKLQIWTVDGPLLEQLRLYAGIEDGDTLLPTPGRSISRQAWEQRPKYHKGMRAHDVVELVAATLAQSGAIDVGAERLRPAEFGGRAGFRFDLRFESDIGVRYRGLATGMITQDGRLHLILYMGAQPHYFDAYEAIIRRILSSVILL